ncbi:hypothetical protein PSN45_000886 [Yamadazyma tenuis]|nr:hypothetical protein PSN45_000886 [Yamadazyma tenuis]
MLSRLTGCENICQLVSHHTTDTAVYLVLEYCAGGDLHEHSRRHRVSSTDLYTIATQLYAAISHAHRRGVFHRDLKPENILLSTPGSFHKLKLCDWGLSTTSRICNQFNVGTEKYMAPEVFINNYTSELKLTCYDAKYVDYWSFGMSLVTVLFGRSPFTAPAGRSLMSDTNYKRFVLLNQKHILYEIYPNLNARGYSLFARLFCLSGGDDNANDFMLEIKRRDLASFLVEFRRCYRQGLTVDESEGLELYRFVRSGKSAGTITSNRPLLVDEFSLNWFE